MTVSINSTAVSLIIDSGASVNLISASTLAAITPRPTPSKSTIKLFAYGSKTPIDIVGEFRAVFEARQGRINSFVYVVAGRSESLLSYSTATDLGLIKIDVMTVDEMNNIPLTIADLSLKHPELFQGIGMLRNQ